MDDVGSWHFATFVSIPNSIDLLEFCGTDGAHVVRGRCAAVDDVAALVEEDKVLAEVAAMLAPLPYRAKMATMLHW